MMPTLEDHTHRIAHTHKLFVGTGDVGDYVFLDKDTLARHISIFGQTGCGKTVCIKAIVEEALLSSIPAIVIDIEGDLSAMILRKSITNLNNVVEQQRHRLYYDKVEMRVFTPLSDSGIPMSINPMKYLKGIREMKDLDRIQYMDFVSINILGVLDISENVAEYEDLKRSLYKAIEGVIKQNNPTLSMIIDNIDDKSHRKKLKKAMLKLDYGVNKILFSDKHSYGIEDFITPSRKGKIPLNIINLSSLVDFRHRRAYVFDVAMMIFEFMLINIRRKLLFVLDEAKEFIPPNPYMPPTKPVIQTLTKRGRKSNVFCVLATQNAKDVDYHTFGQSNTFFIGKIGDEADLKVAREKIKSYEGYEEILKILPILKIGTFYIFSPDNFDGLKRVDIRQLYSKHKKIDSITINKHRNLFMDFNLSRQSGGKLIENVMRRCSRCGYPLNSGTVCESCGELHFDMISV